MRQGYIAESYYRSVSKDFQTSMIVATMTYDVVMTFAPCIDVFYVGTTVTMIPDATVYC